jgi:hypothetical protein
MTRAQRRTRSAKARASSAGVLSDFRAPVAIFRERVAPSMSAGQLVPAHIEVTRINLAAHPTS